MRDFETAMMAYNRACHEGAVILKLGFSNLYKTHISRQQILPTVDEACVRSKSVVLSTKWLMQLLYFEFTAFNFSFR